MEDFLIKFEQGLKGENKGLRSGLKEVCDAIDNIQKETNYVIMGQPKTFKTKFTDTFFIHYPYLMNDPGILDYTYYSFEVSRIKKTAEWIAFYFWNDYKIKYSANHIMCKGDKKIRDEHIKYVEEILAKRIIPLLGEYDKYGNRTKKGIIDFIEEKDNPTGIYHYLINKAKSNGEIIYEEYETVNDSETKVKKQRMVGFKDNEPKKYRMVIVDHVRLMKRERNYSMKENIDKYSEYTISLRNIFKYSFIDIIHSNRNISDNDRTATNSGRYLKPQTDDVKDSGNLAENCNYLIALFNPYNYPNIQMHYDYMLKDWLGKYRSLHILTARDTEAPKDLFLVGDGANGMFKCIPSPTDKEKFNEFKNKFKEYINHDTFKPTLL